MTLLPTVRTQLVDAVDRSRDRRPLRRLGALSRWERNGRPTGDRLTVVGLVILALVIMVGAFALLRGHQGPRGASSTVPAVTGVQLARRELVEHFAVLRRAQTPADRDPQFVEPLQRARSVRPPGLQKYLKRFGNPRLDRALMRLVSVPAFDAKVAFEPATWAPSSTSSRRSEGLDLVMRIGTAKTIPPAQEFGTGSHTASVETVLDHGLALSDGRIGHNLAGVLAVPDGVARVRLRITHLTDAPGPIPPSAFGTAEATVTSNLAPFELRIPTTINRHRYTALLGMPATAQTTWYNAAGEVIKQTSTHLDVFVSLRGKGPLPHPLPPTNAAARRSQTCRPHRRGCSQATQTAKHITRSSHH